jgi:hypothetical protein
MLDCSEIDQINTQPVWISPSKLNNFLLNDPVLDWYKLYLTKSNDKQDSKFISILSDLGIRFEKQIFKDILEQFPNQVQIIVNDNEPPNRQHFRATKEAIRKQVPILIHPVLYDDEKKFFGVPDIIIRNDWLCKLIPSYSEQINDIYYVVIEIKWTTLGLCADNTHVLNSQRVPAYKGQLLMYTYMLGKIQQFTPSQAYILARRYKTIQSRVTSIQDIYDNIGVVDYQTKDQSYISYLVSAIEWIYDVQLHGKEWDYMNPCRKEMYPNMCNSYDFPFHNVKKKVAQHINELTSVWKVGMKQRQIAHHHGVYSWTDPKCNSSILGFKENKTGQLIDKILDINRNSTKIIQPDQLDSDGLDLLNRENSIFVDFETVQTLFLGESTNIQRVFMIGVCYKTRYYRFKSFVAKQLNDHEERKIFDEFFEFLHHLGPKITVYHHGSIERTVIRDVNERNNNRWDLSHIEMIDTYEMFYSMQIVFRGSLSYSLKDISRAMYDNKQIKSKIPKNGPSDGMDAMVDAIEYYTKKRNKKIMTNILAYNQFDCETLKDIIEFLRETYLE